MNTSKLPKLFKLIDQITPENSHEVIDTGKDIGNEILEHHVAEDEKIEQSFSRG